MKKILNVVYALHSGGIEQFLSNYYLNFNKEKIINEFVVFNTKPGIIEEELKNKGFVIYHLPSRKKHPILLLKKLYRIIKNGNYDIVYSHINFWSWIPMLFAKKCGIKIRISHSHGSGKVSGIFNKFMYYFFRKLILRYSTHCFACSETAGKWLYGKNWNCSEQNLVIHNAIMVDKFVYNSKIRSNYRRKYRINDRICLLSVGRLSKEKNQQFLLEVINCLNPQKYVLVLVGDGELCNELKSKADCLKLKNVLFFGNRKDVHNIYNMADIFLLPSTNEGLGIVGIEAQTNDLYCIFSDGVPKETKMINSTCYLPLDKELWAKAIDSYKLKERKNNKKIIIDAGYYINKESKIIEDYILKL